jgi:hypothetical protein
MKKSFELCCASASSHSADTDEIPVARQALNTLIASGNKNPSLDEVIECAGREHGIRLSKVEAARQLDGHRQGHSKTSAKAHELSSAASEASDRVRNAVEGDDPVELHTAAQTAHEEAARAHWAAVHYHGRAATYHGEKVKNQSVELDEPADEETTENVSD